MRPAFRAFLTELIDYAGLFPPAALDLEPAIRNHLAYLRHEDAWMLGRFIVPAARLDDLDAFADEFRPFQRRGIQPGVRFSLLGLAGVPGGLGATMEATAERARAFEARHEGGVRCDRFELRAAPDDLGGLGETLGAMEWRESDAVAVEIPMTGDAYAPDRIEHAAHAVAEANARAGHQHAALKLRCGGVTPDLVPDVERLAHAVWACRDAGAPFKATAGLHHPFPNWDEAVGARMHGFVNLFGGACLAHAHNLDRDALAEVLDDADVSHFALADDFSWRGHRVSAEAVHTVRQSAALSFGSCSFDDPREDLAALGWM